MFTHSEAKDLIRKHDLLRVESGKLGLMRTTAESNVRRAAVSPTVKQAMTTYAEGEFTADPEAPLSAVYPGGVKPLLTALYTCRAQREMIDRYTALVDANKVDIASDQRTLSVGTGTISWMFAGSAKKAAAELAYNRLKELMEGDYGRELNELLSSLKNFTLPDDITLIRDFRENLSEYEKLVSSIDASIIAPGDEKGCSGPIIRELARIANVFADARKKTQQLEASERSSEKNIVDAAECYRAEEALRLMHEMPVEELNRAGGSGIRVKTLRDAGYETIADVSAASVRELEAVNGVSLEGARQIHEIVSEVAKSLMETAKIKLTTDRKTQGATQLVSAICAERQRQAAMTEVEALERSAGPEVKRALELIPRYANAARWMFLSDDRRKKFRSLYRTALEAEESGYAASLSRAADTALNTGALSGAQAWADFEKNSADYYAILERLVPGLAGTADVNYGLPEDLAAAIQAQTYDTTGLNCTLRTYQDWGVRYILCQKRVLLGDEMGLGKTVQAIAAMVALRNTGSTHFLVVAPASVLSNWCREVAKMSDLRVVRVHGADRGSASADWREKGGVAVTTYETTGALELEDEFRFDMLVVDEAHYIKNPGAARSRNTAALCKHTDRILFMTGTALENRVDEMVELVRHLQQPIASKIAGMTYMAYAPQFRELVAPVYYRRRRDDVLTELPDLIESQEWCTLLKEEKKIYEAAVLDNRFMDARRVSWNIDDLSKSSKALRLKDIAQEAEADGRKLLIFSFFRDTISKVEAMFGDKCMQTITGAVAPQRRQEIIDEFDQAAPGAVLAAQIQAGGTGLNIQSASVVVICEPQLKPSIENQAIARAYRMGQTRSVLVYRLLGDDTIDERITEILEEKQSIFDNFADQSAAEEESRELVEQETLQKAMEEEAERIRREHEAAEGGAGEEDESGAGEETESGAGEEAEGEVTEAVEAETGEVTEGEVIDNAEAKAIEDPEGEVIEAGVVGESESELTEAELTETAEAETGEVSEAEVTENPEGEETPVAVESESSEEIPEVVDTTAVTAAAPEKDNAEIKAEMPRIRKFCPFCGAKLIENAKFCVACGERQE